MKATRVARKLRVRATRFLRGFSKGLCLPAQRFVSEMVYGIQDSQPVIPLTTEPLAKKMVAIKLEIC